MSDGAKKKSDRSSDDLLALTAVVIGAGIAFLHMRQPIELTGGVGLALGGVLLAVRGDRVVQGRGWLRAALVVSALATLLAALLRLYAEWIVGQWFSEGAQPGDTAQEIRRMAYYGNIFRFVGFGLGLAFLIGALFSRGPVTKDARQ
jgi:hypothetical protein